ncbi:hypothetical protein BD410DRAFT_805915 [Rickenella mellea]|uniref:WW domain-containing protein n=1 Tax=Rickenella mellea TaxID=50990 RepID=A0A4Y7PV96_9AGAM|nr:hypothetical protein BD410DRAFT_805915 [Rickenella mellea]
MYSIWMVNSAMRLVSIPNHTPDDVKRNNVEEVGHVAFHSRNDHDDAAAPPFVSPTMIIEPPLPPGWTEHIKKEKPMGKTPIPGTDCPRVRTNEGNIFYTNKAKNESVWTVPEEIKEAVENLEKEEAIADAKRLEDEQRARESAEVEKVKREVDAVIAKRTAKSRTQRKTKRRRVAWRARRKNSRRRRRLRWLLRLRKMLVGWKKEQERLKKRRRKQRRAKEGSSGEGDTRYQHACKSRPIHRGSQGAVQKTEPRAAKVASQKAESVDPKEEFEQLLREEAGVERVEEGVEEGSQLLWMGSGGSREGEEIYFGSGLKSLRNRAAARKAEADFIGLLKENGGIKPDSVWKDVSEAQTRQGSPVRPRRSSSLREEIFNTYVKALSAVSSLFAKSNGSAMSFEEQFVTWTIRRKSEVGSEV